MTEFTIGGVHEFTDGSDESRAIGAEGLVPHVESWVAFVLKRAGIDDVPKSRAEIVEIARLLPNDEIEALALGMADKLIGIQVSRMVMRSRGLPDSVIDELIALSAELGMNYSVLTSVERGISDAASYGMKAKSDRGAGAAAANAPKSAERRRRKAKTIEVARGELGLPPPGGRWTLELLAEQTLIGMPAGLDWSPRIAAIRRYLREAVDAGDLVMPT